MNAVIFTLSHQLSLSHSELFATVLWSLWKKKKELETMATKELEDWRPAQIIWDGRVAPTNTYQLDSSHQDTNTVGKTSN